MEKKAVTTGKGAGETAMRARSIISGRQVIMYSVRAGGESCRIQNGNVFGN